MSTPLCAKSCARESRKNENKAAFISGEFTVMNRELLYSVLKDLCRESVGSPALGRREKDIGILERGDSLSLVRRWETVCCNCIHAAEFKGVSRGGMAEPGRGGSYT